MTKKEAIALFGSQSKLAQALGLSRQAVSKWGDDLPLLRVYQIKELKAKKDEI
jgi:transcriptional repressor of cell division inhibition gene dicB